MNEPDFYKLYCAEVRYKQMLESRMAELQIQIQTLNEIKAQAIEEMLNKVHSHSRDGDVVGYVDIVDYANKLRES